ncbi:MAG: alkaline phosphatase family protein [bacterium]|nr:alkaline phosphatase family protein [bacterium]
MEKKKRKVLLVGWDACDWKLCDQLMAEGHMPAFKSIVDRGVRGKIATLDPPLSPMLWTSMATGVRPYKHGVLGFVESNGKGGIMPISSQGRKVDAFWNMFTKEGLKSNVVAWWPSNPVESINGVMVSNRFHLEKDGNKVLDAEDWPIAPASVYPESLAESLAELRVHPQDISGHLVTPFVPRAVELNKKESEETKLKIIAKFLAHSSSVHAVTTELLDTTEWDITAVYHDAMDHFCHAFMKFHPPKMEGMSEEAFELYSGVVRGAYVWHDMMLQRLLSQIDEDTTVIICSDHGFHSDHLRPKFLPNVPSGPAIEHAPYGVFVAAGPGIKKGEHIYGASILDITPTLLTLFDLPVGRDMDGKPLMEMYEDPKPVKYIDSWQNDERFGGELVADFKGEDAGNEAALQQLIDLGYINDLQIEKGEDAEQVSKEYFQNTMRENNFYLAKSYASNGKYEECLEIMLEIEDRNNPDFRYLIETINAAIKTKRFALAEEYLEYFNKMELFAPSYLDILQAKVQLGLNNPRLAFKALERATKNYPDSIEVLVDMGQLLNALRESDRAMVAFGKAIEKDPDNPHAHLGYGVAAKSMEDYETALEYFLNAIDCIYHFPLAHLHLGETLALMKEYETAKRSFEVVIAMKSPFIKAYRWLYDLAEITENEEEIKKYKALLDTISQGTKTVITGLPGEKLVRILESLSEQGISIFGKDDLLGENFPQGNEWYDDVNEELIYVPMSMLGSIPERYSYRLLFVNDNHDDVAMYINEMGKLRKATYNQNLLEAIKKQEEVSRVWMSQQPNLDIVYLNRTEDVNTDLIQAFIS